MLEDFLDCYFVFLTKFTFLELKYAEQFLYSNQSLYQVIQDQEQHNLSKLDIVYL
jgi:hypothetical protein